MMLERQESQRDKPVIVHAVPRVLLAMVIAACTLATGETRAQAAAVHSLDEAIVLATGYLARVCAPDGQFTYRINLDPQVTPAPRYNVLRHAGTTWSLVVAQQWRPDPDARAAAIRAAAFLRERCIAPVPGEEDLLAVWSDPELNRSGNLRQAKLGGTGLGLVALASLEAIEPGATPRDDLRSMGRFILSMQKPDGSFYGRRCTTRVRPRWGCSCSTTSTPIPAGSAELPTPWRTWPARVAIRCGCRRTIGP
jgi:hypothetical protein